MIASRTAFTAALVALLLVAAQTAPVPKDNKGNGNGKADAPGLNKLTSSNAGGLLRGQARAEWARLNASAKKHAGERLDEVRDTTPPLPTV